MPKIVIKEDAASERLLKASAIIAILETRSPTESFIINKSTFTKIPTIPPNIP